MIKCNNQRMINNGAKISLDHATDATGELIPEVEWDKGTTDIQETRPIKPGLSIAFNTVVRKNGRNRTICDILCDSKNFSVV